MGERVEWLSPERATPEFRLISRWFTYVLYLRGRFSARVACGLDPLRSNETASVGLLAAAASCAGLLTLTDYVSFKRSLGADGSYRRGRCDLWVADPGEEVSLAFEFKQCFVRHGLRGETIAAQLGRACDDARRLDLLEAHRRFGGLILSVNGSGSESKRCSRRLAEAGERASYACRMTGGQGPVWLFLQSI
jgi:hypothetical protein